jgi:N-acetylglucosaminyldiphosphoundecaprenol N-acetyl-beta-D-mannosaminyltransferase
MEKMRLNWAYRLYRDPRRLWKRYSLDFMAYGGMVLRQRLTQGRRAAG